MVLTKAQATDFEELFQKIFQREKEDMIKEIKSAFKDEILQLIGKHNEAINNLNEMLNQKNEMIKNMASKIKFLENKSEMAEMYSRKNNIRIYGIPEIEGENILATISNHMAEHLNVEVVPQDVDNCHRLGIVNKQTMNARPRAIIVKFVSYKKKMEILMKRKLLRGTSIAVQEDLTKYKMELYKRAGERFGKTNTWVLNGKIFVKLDTGKSEIKSFDDLQDK